jgi:hypothetical protein
MPRGRVSPTAVDRSGGQGRIIGVGTVSVVSKALRGVVLPSEKILRALNLRVVYLSRVFFVSAAN